MRIMQWTVEWWLVVGSGGEWWGVVGSGWGARGVGNRKW